MKAQDLRVGNIIYQNSKYANNCEDVIVDVYSDSICTESNDQLPLEFVEGVPLTLELIEDSKTKYNKLCFRIEFLEVQGFYHPHIHQILECGTIQQVALKKIQFIHEFQNIIYILTGQIV